MRTLVMRIIIGKGTLETDTIVCRGCLPLLLIMWSTLSSRLRSLRWWRVRSRTILVGWLLISGRWWRVSV